MKKYKDLTEDEKLAYCKQFDECSKCAVHNHPYGCPMLHKPEYVPPDVWDKEIELVGNSDQLEEEE